MSRKFTDSEIRAYSKNRYEEKVLRLKLGKLKEDMGIFHDVSSKQRQNLVDECKEIRMTTGGSPVPKELLIGTPFDFSSRVQRPWAYSVMETTYNMAYKDATIPVPKLKRRKSESDSVRSMPRSARSMFEMRTAARENRVHSSKSYASSKRSHITSFSDSAIKNVALISDFPNKFMCSSRGEESKGASGMPPIDAKLGSIKEDHNQVFQSPNITVDHIDTQNKQSPDTEKREKNNMESKEEINPNNLFVKPVRPESRIYGAPIALPPAYKIDSKDYQDAERTRAINRSKSRVSFSASHVSNDSGNKDAHKPKSASSEKLAPQSEPSKTGSSAVSEQGDSEEIHHDESKGRTHIMTLDPDTMQDANLRNLEDIYYKGRRLRNYIKPEERYKIDPIVMQRRQQKMDKLAKESLTFLKRVNHENIKVDIAFPRSARRRILTKLVQENNSNKSKKVSNDDSFDMKKKIDYFMDSISEYLRKQHLQREHTF
ncbi:uncharacterized protein LOC128237828 [Mya arenaria]|uniref:uncharacterized protein LOC128237828 n=1 Tax=Mya arenaria TaxID=6604 RepID=UPI0022E8D092|nr:uncharacterized protein LOC128237828 [Mya arenaria]